MQAHTREKPARCFSPSQVSGPEFGSTKRAGSESQILNQMRSDFTVPEANWKALESAQGSPRCGDEPLANKV